VASALPEERNWEGVSCFPSYIGRLSANFLKTLVVDREKQETKRAESEYKELI
jgi:hypothetical protein